MLNSLRWRTGGGSGSRVESGLLFSSSTTPRMPFGSFLIHALSQLPMYPPPRQLRDSEICRAIRIGPGPAKSPIQMWHSEYRHLRCRGPRVFPLVRESPPTIPLGVFSIHRSLDSPKGVLHAERHTQLPTLRAMVTKNRRMKSLSPWRANRAVCAQAFIKFAMVRQWRLHQQPAFAETTCCVVGHRRRDVPALATPWSWPRPGRSSGMRAWRRRRRRRDS